MSKIINYLLIPAVSLMAAGCGSRTAAPAIIRDAEVERQVEEILSGMTLEEKVGQMTELAIDVLGEFRDGEFVLDEEKLRKVIAEYKVGSILNAPGPMAQDIDKWQEIIGRIQEMSMKEIGIPCIYGLDQVHGTTYILQPKSRHMRPGLETVRGHTLPPSICLRIRAGREFGKTMEKTAL